MKRIRKIAVLLLALTLAVPFQACNSNVTITFDSDGGSEVKSITLKSGSVIEEQPETERTGYVFTGWYDEDAGETVKFPYTVRKNKEFLALWDLKIYTITFITGIGIEYPVMTYTIEGDENGESVRLGSPASQMIPEGYKFEGWFLNPQILDQTEGDAITSLSLGTIGNKTYYAGWSTAAYTITYHLNGGNFNGNYAMNYTGKSDIILTSPHNARNKFTGWYDNVKLEGEPIERISVGSIGNKEFWAAWANVDYMITYNTDDGVLEGIYPQGYDSGEEVALPGPVRRGYEFKGWFINSNLTDTAVIKILSTDTGDKEYWAKWEIIDYTITYNLNGGSLTADYPQKYNINSGIIMLPQPTHPANDFGGWYDNASFSGNAVVQISTNSTGHKEYWAKWSAKAVTTQTFSFEAENTNLTGKRFQGQSGTANGGKAIQDVNGASGGMVVGWLHADGTSLEFYINSDRAVTGALLQLWLSIDANFGEIAFTSNDISIIVNGAAFGFEPTSIFATSGVHGGAETAFYNIDIKNVPLVAGQNTIQVKFNCNKYTPACPLFDRLDITTAANLNWTPFINNRD